MEERRRSELRSDALSLKSWTTWVILACATAWCAATILVPFPWAMDVAGTAYLVCIFSLAVHLIFADRRLVVLLFILNLGCSLVLMTGVSLHFLGLDARWPTSLIVVLSQTQWLTVLGIIVATNNRGPRDQLETFMPIAVFFIAIGALRIVDADTLTYAQIRILNVVQDLLVLILALDAVIFNRRKSTAVRMMMMSIFLFITFDLAGVLPHSYMTVFAPEMITETLTRFMLFFGVATSWLIGLVVWLPDSEQIDLLFKLDPNQRTRQISADVIVIGLPLLILIFGTAPSAHAGLILGMASMISSGMIFIQYRHSAKQLEQVNEGLKRSVTTDPLTQLANRHGLSQSLEAMEHLGASAWFIDLNDFKVINDHYGHAVGDAVLQYAATQLQAVSEPGDVVSRYGGDEFAIIRPEPRPLELSSFARTLEQAVNQDVTLNGQPVSIRASVGSALAGAGPDVYEVVHFADLAMYMKKTRKMRQRTH